MAKKSTDVDPKEAKEAILGYCLRKGALAAGVADLEALERIAPAGHRPSDKGGLVRDFSIT